jgi:hypothetical protein
MLKKSVTPTKIKFSKYEDPNGVLCVYESGSHVPFDIRRVFTVTAGLGDIRGDHAHKECIQLLVCLSGVINVICDNGNIVSEYRLDNMDEGLLIPPGIWAKQEYVTGGAILMVLCDREYLEDDYLRDYKNFKTFFVYEEA